MTGRFWYFVFALQIVSWVSATSRPFVPNHGIHHPGTGQAPRSSPATSDSKQDIISTEYSSEITEEGYAKGLSKIGSSPPSCEHKCYGCTPCEAIQVPTTSRRSHMHIQYANYEPEGWKCKCGPSLYSP
ncbi:Epidermal patterning factor-like protein [Quillaja saponaria]|uniref:Epidermal patterning factor-like protein n=1 Tax=Quillaja saponaria TaxID=32244 RepID=A0AAD7LUA3_QUISA|nr:Epidermal patterning factor-like protein [Quillaja saponaria]